MTDSECNTILSLGSFLQKTEAAYLRKYIGSNKLIILRLIAESQNPERLHSNSVMQGHDITIQYSKEYRTYDKSRT